MTESVTQHYSWTKPEVTKSASTWGGFLNTDLDSIDALVFANQQGIVPIGSITMFGGATAPANWLICDGRSLDTTAYASLFAVLQYTYGGSGANFNLPNLTSRFPMGAGTLAATGGEANHTLSTAEMPVHAHGVTDPTHGHVVSDPTHGHVVSDPTHTHGVTQSQHTHQIGVVSGGGSGVAAGAGNSFTTTQTGGNTIPISINAAGTGVGIAASPTNISIQASPTYIGIQNAGSSAAHNNLPPYLQINFIVRFS